MVPDRCERDDEGRRGVVASASTLSWTPSSAAGPVHHAGELAAADDADDRESAGGALRARSRGARISVVTAGVRPCPGAQPAGD